MLLIDHMEYTTANAESLTKHLEHKKSQLVFVPSNLVDEIWHDRPHGPKNFVFHLDVKYSGEFVGWNN
jgi:Xaa-Pro aminopeptidase